MKSLKYSHLIFIILFNILSMNIHYINCELSCNFEKDFCGYESRDSFEKFERYSGKSPSLTSGPVYDKTTEDDIGHYALCNGKLLKDPTTKCLMEQSFNLDKEAEFEFWQEYIFFKLKFDLKLNLILISKNF